MGKKITKVLYGEVALLRGYCRECQGYSFIIDGKFECCGSIYDDMIERQKIKRECQSENIRSLFPASVKKEVLKRQNYKCIYCGIDLRNPIWNEKKCRFEKSRVNYDHFVPWVYSGDNSKNNLYASCSICNRIKSDSYFYDLISAREHILQKRIEQGYD